MKPTKSSRKSLLRPTLAALILALLVSGVAGWAGEVISTAESQVLARVEAPGSLKDLNLPVYAGLQDAAGKYYALVIATLSQLKTAGVSFQTLDSYQPGARYLIARERRAGARREAASAAKVLYDDGRRLLEREVPGLAAGLTTMGFAPKRLPESPLSLAAPAKSPLLTAAFAPNPLVAGMMARVYADDVESYISGLSGVTPVEVEGEEYTIATRHTESGTPLEKATQYIYERLQAWDLAPSFQSWTAAPYAGRNVIGNLPGVSLPGEIVLLVAHVDDLPEGAVAPGADDNASGCATLLVAAEIMSRYYRFQRTIKFLFTTGEEQDLYGAYHYAASVAGQDIIAVINVDNIAYIANTAQKSSQVHIRIPGDPGNPADREIAETFVNVVNNYGLSNTLQPVIAQDGESAGDHYAFWTATPVSFPGMLVIEDDVNHYNPNNHKATDKLDFLNMDYCTAQVKASMGAAAHLAGILAAGQDPWLMLLLDEDED